MNTVKRLLSVMLAVMMIASLASTAFAATTVKLTINGTTEGKTYAAYQIFKGTIRDDGVMGQVEWGSGIDGDAFLAALKADAAFGTGNSNSFYSAANAAGVATTISGWSRNDAHIKRFAEVAASNLNVTGQKTGTAGNDGKCEIYLGDNDQAVGYYLIRETTDNNSMGEDSYTDYLVDISSSTTIAPKITAPMLTYGVNYIEDATYGKATDIEVGSNAYYELQIAMPNLLLDYKQFYLKIDIDMPAGLVMSSNIDSNPVYNKAYIRHNNGSTSDLKRVDDYSITFDPDGAGAVINFKNLRDSSYDGKLTPNDKIVIKFAATLNDKAVMSAANDNLFDISIPELGNESVVEVYYSNDLNQTTGEITYSSKKASASVYTYQVEFKKQDQIKNETVLSGAQFILYRERLIGSNLEPYYAKVDSNGNITEWVTDKAAASVLTSGDDGMFYIKGLDSLVYKLEEIKAPAGYNKNEYPLPVTLNATFEGQNLKTLSCTAENTLSANSEQLKEGKVSADVYNTPGNALPSTGGMGTTLFYIVGAMLLLGSSVIFILKRRNEA